MEKIDGVRRSTVRLLSLFRLTLGENDLSRRPTAPAEVFHSLHLLRLRTS